MSMKNSSDIIENRNLDLRLIVRQPAAPPDAPPELLCIIKTSLLKMFRETIHVNSVSNTKKCDSYCA